MQECVLYVLLLQQCSVSPLWNRNKQKWNFFWGFHGALNRFGLVRGLNMSEDVILHHVIQYRHQIDYLLFQSSKM